MKLRERIARWVYSPPPPPRVAESRMVRARPGQAMDASMYAWGIGQNCNETLVMYAYNSWVQTAVGRMASRAASAALQVVFAADPIRQDETHPLLRLLGPLGRPNDYQDSLEFLEMSIMQFLLAGNSFWFWASLFGGAPDEVHLLDPACIKIVPGRNLGVSHYEYRPVGGKMYPLMPEQVTHFKRPNPMNIYWGLSALEALKVEVMSDRSMAIWNAEFFSEDVAIPAGIVVLPSNTPDAEMDRLDDELHAKHGGKRRTAMVRAEVGATAYLPAGVAPKDLDFANGRLLSRKAVYEALELPLGLMSEASTEAHARVAERQLFESVNVLLSRFSRKLDGDALPFWPSANQRLVKFEDLSLRAADWDRESKRLAAVKPFMSINEVRTQILHLPADTDPTNDKVGGANVPTSAAGQTDRGDSSPVPGDGQTEDVVR